MYLGSGGFEVLLVEFEIVIQFRNQFDWNFFDWSFCKTLDFHRNKNAVSRWFCR